MDEVTWATRQRQASSARAKSPGAGCHVRRGRADPRGANVSRWGGHGLSIRGAFSPMGVSTVHLVLLAEALSPLGRHLLDNRPDRVVDLPALCDGPSQLGTAIGRGGHALHVALGREIRYELPDELLSDTPHGLQAHGFSVHCPLGTPQRRCPHQKMLFTAFRSRSGTGPQFV